VRPVLITKVGKGFNEIGVDLSRPRLAVDFAPDE